MGLKDREEYKRLKEDKATGLKARPEYQQLRAAKVESMRQEYNAAATDLWSRVGKAYSDYDYKTNYGEIARDARELRLAAAGLGGQELVKQYDALINNATSRRNIWSQYADEDAFEADARKWRVRDAYGNKTYDEIMRAADDMAMGKGELVKGYGDYGDMAMALRHMAWGGATSEKLKQELDAADPNTGNGRHEVSHDAAVLLNKVKTTYKDDNDLYTAVENALRGEATEEQLRLIDARLDAATKMELETSEKSYRSTKYYDEIKSYYEQAVENEKNAYYNSLRDEADFAEKSKFRGIYSDDFAQAEAEEGTWMATRNAVLAANEMLRNDEHGIYSMENARRSGTVGLLDDLLSDIVDTSNIQGGINLLPYMSADEIKTLTYVFNTQGAPAASIYLSRLEPELENRSNGKWGDFFSGMFEYYDSVNPVLGGFAKSVANATAITASPLIGVEGLANLAAQTSDLITGDNAAERGGLLSDIQQGVRSATAEYINSPEGKFAYNIANSVLDNLATVYEVGLAASGGEALAAAIKDNQNIVLALMSAQTVVPAYEDAKAKGYDNAKASMMSALAFVAEWISETYSIEALLGDPQKLLTNLLKSGIAEGAEEGVSKAINTLGDAILNGGDSEIQQRARQLVVQKGVSYDEALKMAFGEWGVETLGDMAAGFISGAIFAAAGNVKTISERRSTGNSIQNIEAKPETLEGDIAPEMGKAGAQVLATEVLDRYGKDTYEGRQATAVLDAINSNKKASNYKVGSLVDFLATDMVEQSKKEGGKLTYREAYGQVNRMIGNARITTGLQEMQKRPEEWSAKVLADNPKKRGEFEAVSGLTLNGTEKENVKAINEWKKQFEVPEGAETYTLGSEDIKGIVATDARGHAVLETDAGNIQLERVNFTGGDITKRMYEAAANYGTVAAKAFVKGYQAFSETSRPTLDNYKANFNVFYGEGTIGGRTFEQALEANPNVAEALGVEVAKAAFDAGVQLREASSYQGRTNNIRKAEGKATNTSGKNDAETEAFTFLLKRIAEKVGADMELGHLDEEGNVFGYTVESTLKILLDADAPNKYGTLFHELTELIGLRDENELADIRQSVLRFYAQTHGYTSVDEMSRKYQERYSEYEGGKSWVEAQNEFVGDVIGGLFAADEGVDQFINWANENETPQTRNKLYNWFANVIAKIRTLLENIIKKGTLNEAQQGGLDAARQNLELANEVRQMFLDALSKTAAEAKVVESESARNAKTDVYGDNNVPAHPDTGVRNQLAMSAEIADKTRKYNDTHNAISSDEMEAGIEVMEAMADVMRPYLNVDGILPPDIPGKTFMKDASYGGSSENTTICVRTLTYEDFKDRVAEAIGRPLTTAESLLVSQKIYDIAVEPQCIYCYVAADRKAYDDFLGQYWTAMDSAITRLRNGEDADAVYKDYLNGRKDTDAQKKRFAAWKKIASGNAKYITAEDLATKRNRDRVINKGGDLATQVRDAQRYAQSASWAKKIIDYRAYAGDILKMKPSLIAQLNSEYGLRMYSFSDYTPAFIVENMQMLLDASARGVKSLAYTKDTAYAKIFAKTGQAINVSLFASLDPKTGTYKENTRNGASWAEAQELRKQYDNVGTVMVCTNDSMVSWALQQDWIDVVIPYHIVKTGTVIANEYDWRNYTAASSDRANGKAANIYPTEHNNDFETFRELVEERGIKPRFNEWYQKALDGEITGAQYMKLVNEVRLPASKLSPVKPVFDLDAAMESFGVRADGSVIPGGFVDKGGYMGGWYRDGVDVNQEVKAVADDITTGKTVQDVDYGSDLVRKGVRRQIDVNYMPLAEKYRDGTATAADEAELRKMVEARAREQGFDSPMLFHGTNAFGFTRADTSAPGGDGYSFWTSTDATTSATYTAYGKVRGISSEITYEDELAAEDEVSNEIDDAIDDFRTLIDRYFSEWVFGQTDNSYLRHIVDNANPTPGYGDGVYDKLVDIVGDAYSDFGEEYESKYEDFAEWQENSPEFEELEKAIIGIESLRITIADIEERGLRGGIYQFYGKTENLYEIDAKGKAWNTLRSDELPKLSRYGIDDVPYRTRDVTTWALDKGYDGVKFKDVLDSGGWGRIRTPADVYAFFKPNEQLKSADLVTYDDNGEIIPLSERFTEVDDFRRQIDVDVRKYKNALRSNEQLRDINTGLIEQMRKGAETTLNVEYAASRILRKNQSRYSNEQLQKDIMELRDMATNGAMNDEIVARADRIARDILEQSKAYKPLGETEKAILNDVKSRPFRVSAVQKIRLLGEYGVDYDGFIDQFGDYFTISEDGQTLTEMYRDLEKAYPEYFTPTKSTDIPIHLVAALQALSENFDNKFTLDEASALLGNELLVSANELSGDTKLAKQYRAQAEQIASDYEAKVTNYEAPIAQYYEDRIKELAYNEEWSKAEADYFRKAEIAKRLAKQKAAFEARIRSNNESRKERNARTALRRSIRRITADLQTRLNHPTKNSYVPKDLVGLVIDLAQAVDIATSYRIEPEQYNAIREAREAGQSIKSLATEYGITENYVRKILEGTVNFKAGALGDSLYKIQTGYAALKGKDNSFAYSDENKRLLDSLIAEVGSAESLRAMNYKQLSAINNLLKFVQNQILESTKARAFEKNANLIEAGTHLISDILAVDKAFSNKASQLIMRAERPTDMFDHIGGYAKGNYANEIGQSLNKAQREELMVMYAFFDSFSNVLDFENKELKDAYKKMHSTKAEDMIDVGLKDENGDKVLLTHGFATALYANLIREDNLRHIMIGGFTLPDVKDHYNGKNGFDKEGTRVLGHGKKLNADYKAYQAKLEDARAKGATEEQLKAIDREYKSIVDGVRATWGEIASNIYKKLSNYDKKWLAAVDNFYNVLSKNAINEMTQRMYGFDMATVDDYYPLFVDKDFLGTETQTINDIVTVDNGNLQTRVYSGKPILLGDIAIVADNQIKKIARQVAFTPILSDINKIRSVSTEGYETAVAKALKKTYGDDGVNDLITDTLAAVVGQNGRQNWLDKQFDKLRGLAAQSSLLANIGVALGQTSSYPTAAAIIGWEPLLKAFAVKPGGGGVLVWKAELDEINKWSPYLRNRSRFNANTGYEYASVKPTLTQRAPAIFGWIEAMDKATVGRLWYACKYYVNDNYSNLEQGSDEYFEKVAEVFEQVVQETQPNYTTMQRPAMLRAKSGVGRFMWMFYTQRLQNFNVLYGSMARLLKYSSDFKNGKNGVTNADVKQARRSLRHGISAVMIGQLTYTLFKALADFIRHNWKDWWDDEEQEYSFWEGAMNLGDKYIGNLVSSVPIASQIYEMVDAVIMDKYYDGAFSDLPGLSAITDLTADVVNIGKKIKKGNDVSGTDIVNTLTDVIDGIGLPASNVYKIYNGAQAYIGDAAHGDWGYGGELDTASTTGRLKYAFSTGENIEETIAEERAVIKAEQEAKYPGATEAEIKKDTEDALRAKVSNILRPQYKAAYEAGDTDAMYDVQQQMKETKLYEDIAKTCKKWQDAADEEKRKKGISQ